MVYLVVGYAIHGERAALPDALMFYNRPSSTDSNDNAVQTRHTRALEQKPHLNRKAGVIYGVAPGAKAYA